MPNADMKCDCGGSVFSFQRVLETMPDGRSFELTSVGGEIPHILLLTCLTCSNKFFMGSKPNKEHGNRLLPFGSKEATDFLEDQRPPENGAWTHEHSVDVPGA